MRAIRRGAIPFPVISQSESSLTNNGWLLHDPGDGVTLQSNIVTRSYA